MIDFPEAKAGQELTPSMWERAKAFVRRNQLLPGFGIMLKYGPYGTIISAKDQSAVWDSPFKCGLKGQSGASVATGWINGSVEPEINQIPLSGNAKNAPPTLDWATPDLDPDGTGYIAVELQWDDQWNLVAKHAASVIQCAYLDRDSGDAIPAPGGSGSVPILPGRRARWALARLRRNTQGQLQLYQVTQGDLQCKPQPKSLGSDNGRAFFW